MWNKVPSIILIFNDISEQVRKKQNKQIKAYQNKILEYVSHNLKTPLHGLELYIETLKSKLSDFPSLSDLLESIDVNCILLNQMINDILEYSDLSTKKQMSLQVQKFQVSQPIRLLSYMFQKQCASKSIDFQIKLSNISQD